MGSRCPLMVSYQVKLPDFPIPPPLTSRAIHCLCCLFVIYGLSSVALEKKSNSIVLTKVCVLFLSFKNCLFIINVVSSIYIFSVHIARAFKKEHSYAVVHYANSFIFHTLKRAEFVSFVAINTLNTSTCVCLSSSKDLDFHWLLSFLLLSINKVRLNVEEYIVELCCKTLLNNLKNKCLLIINLGIYNNLLVLLAIHPQGTNACRSVFLIFVLLRPC